jgi:hypothetical protein
MMASENLKRFHVEGNKPHDARPIEELVIQLPCLLTLPPLYYSEQMSVSPESEAMIGGSGRSYDSGISQRTIMEIDCPRYQVKTLLFDGGWLPLEKGDTIQAYVIGASEREYFLPRKDIFNSSTSKCFVPRDLSSEEKAFRIEKLRGLDVVAVYFSSDCPAILRKR